MATFSSKLLAMVRRKAELAQNTYENTNVSFSRVYDCFISRIDGILYRVEYDINGTSETFIPLMGMGKTFTVHYPDIE